jgi:hypothetical protein
MMLDHDSICGSATDVTRRQTSVRSETVPELKRSWVTWAMAEKWGGRRD